MIGVHEFSISATILSTIEFSSLLNLYRIFGKIFTFIFPDNTILSIIVIILRFKNIFKDINQFRKVYRTARFKLRGVKFSETIYFEFTLF